MNRYIYEKQDNPVELQLKRYAIIFVNNEGEKRTVSWCLTLKEAQEMVSNLNAHLTGDDYE